jgi:hypothetical protein
MSKISYLQRLPELPRRIDAERVTTEVSTIRDKINAESGTEKVYWRSLSPP